MTRFSNSIERLSLFNRATQNCVRGIAMGAALLAGASALPSIAYAQSAFGDIGGDIRAEDERLLLDADTLTFDSNRNIVTCLLYTSPSPRDLSTSRMPSSA